MGGVGETNDTRPAAALRTEKVAMSSAWHQRHVQETEKTRAVIFFHVPKLQSERGY